jgi:D-sedoheptulose 7-phosphate isomerase
MTAAVKKHFEDAFNLLQQLLEDEAFMSNVGAAGALMANAVSKGNKVISCGNGGSMCDAMHFAEELTGRYRDNRPSLPAISISDPSHLTCVGNDYGFDYVFSRYIEGLGIAGDVLLAISTSGNSNNVLEAAKMAKAKGLMIVGLTGKDGGQLGPLCDVEIRVPWFGYADRIQEVHIKVIHCLIDLIESSR